MALEDNDTREVKLPRDNNFYRDHYHHVLMGVILVVAFLIGLVSFVYYQLMHRPLPQFGAQQPNGQQMFLIPYDQPNMLPSTILQWASKAATIAYTFDFVNYNGQIQVAKPYFTEAGWQDYLSSVSNLINTIVQNKLFINGVVAGTPVISNQGPIGGNLGNQDPLTNKYYAWRIQIPFLVTFQSANDIVKRRYYVAMTIVRVPTSINKAGIGIDQFNMIQR